MPQQKKLFKKDYRGSTNKTLRKEILNTTRVQKVVLYFQLPIKPEQGGVVSILQNNPSVPPQPHEADKATNPAKTDLFEARAPVARPTVSQSMIR
ncbi:hypothetical protein V502_03674 [Pseudogymnoascus sp. VKM F-4520 (FW-2644)]|nr:hypothetical protein V502_03674 [Pseudogymnoascus sp. VKM F-4520 (FW-2644)]